MVNSVLPHAYSPAVCSSSFRCSSATSLSQLEAFAFPTVNVPLNLHRIHHCFSFSFRRNLCISSEISAALRSLSLSLTLHSTRLSVSLSLCPPLSPHLSRSWLDLACRSACRSLSPSLLDPLTASFRRNFFCISSLEALTAHVPPLQQFSNAKSAPIVVSELCASSNHVSSVSWTPLGQSKLVHVSLDDINAPLLQWECRYRPRWPLYCLCIFS